MSSLAASFAAGLAESGKDLDDVVGWEAALARRSAEAAASWPGVAIAPATYARALGEKVGEHDGDPAAVLPRLHANDLYLATACAAGDRAAIAILHGQLVPQVLPALRQLGADASAAADIVQQVLEQLLVGVEGRPPRIAGYGGRGDLVSWLRSVAVRTALKAMARQPRTAAWDDDLDDRLVADDPALGHLKQRYASELNAALRGALAALSVRQRLLLRLHYLDGLTVDQLGRMFRVHRATAARWVVAARDALFEETRLRAVGAGVADAELTSVVRLVQSQLHLSLSGLLATEERTP
jgi:RNA polymerase sigma-70 factor (ECF subfamily)